MGGKVLNIIGRASLALLATALSPQMPVLAQSTNLAYQVANLGEDVRILQESIKSMRVQVESMRRENDQMRRQIGAYESRIDNSMGQLATVGQLNQAIAKAIASLEQRDEKMKSEIILQVTEQITDFAGSVKQTLGNLPAPPEKPDPDCSRVFMTISLKRI